MHVFGSGRSLLSLEQNTFMTAKEFNSQVDLVLAPILAEAGFKKVGPHFVREHDSSQLVLFRFAGSKFASLCQFTKFMHALFPAHFPSRRLGEDTGLASERA
jgi:hypothetical protein